MKPKDVGPRARASGTIIFGLSFTAVAGATFPVISTDDGRTWRIDGPRFHLAAAQAPAVTCCIGAAPPESAFAWGSGGSEIKVTRDGGKTWFITSFEMGVVRVWSRGTALLARVFGNGGVLPTFLYVSNDYGMTWTLRRQLRPYVKQ